MLEHAARRAVELRYGFLVRGDDVHDILAAPIDDAGVALAHGHAHVHGGTFDESAHAARFFAGSFAFTAQLLALEIQFISIAPAGGLLAIKKLYELFLANVGGRSALSTQILTRLSRVSSFVIARSSRSVVGLSPYSRCG